MWAGNAVVGRIAAEWIPPITFNFLRWVLVLIILLPLASWVLRRNSPLWGDWKRFALLGLLSVAYPQPDRHHRSRYTDRTGTTSV